MARTFLTFATLFAAIVAFAYQIYLKPTLKTFGRGRILESVGNTHCIGVSELQACEKLIIHQPSGLVYLACSTPEVRPLWMPAARHLNASGRSETDYIATYNHKTSRVTQLEVLGYNSNRGLSLHGMDVVPSSINPSELFIYLVNHRAPFGEKDASVVGADSSIEIFKTTVGGSTMTHVKTVDGPLIMTPNDVIGSPDGKSFYFTNDHGTKTGFSRNFEMLGYAATSVAYCHIDEGCKLSITNLHGCNGIARANNGTIYVGNAPGGQLRVMEEQSDNTLVITDVITLDRATDNVSVDGDGVVWVAGFPDALKLVFKHFKDPSVLCPSSALRVSLNSGEGAFFGKKFKVDKVFEDDGTIASGTTSVAHDSQHGLLYLHGLCSPQLTVCKI